MRKIIIFIGLILAIISISCGSYSNAKEYALKNVDSVAVISKIKDLKKQHPDLIAWQIDSDGEKYNPDGLSYDPIFGYYAAYFRLPVNDTTAVVQVLIAEKSNGSCSILVIGYTFAKDIFRGWQWSHPRSKKEKKQVIKVFEKEVLDKLGIEYRKLWFR